MFGWKMSRRKQVGGPPRVRQAPSPADFKDTDRIQRRGKTTPVAGGERTKAPRGLRAVRPKGTSQATSSLHAALRRQSELNAELTSALRMQRLGRKVSSGYIRRLTKQLAAAEREVEASRNAGGKLWKR